MGEEAVYYLIVLASSLFASLTELQSLFRDEVLCPVCSRWGVVFLCVNAAFALLIAFLLAKPLLDKPYPLLTALAVGLGFQSLLRSKLTSVAGKDVGIEVFYRFWTDFIKERIACNLLPEKIAFKEKLKANPLTRLKEEVENFIANYPLLSAGERREQRDYVRAQLGRCRTPEEKKDFLVSYLYEKVKGNKRKYFRERGLLGDG